MKGDSFSMIFLAFLDAIDRITILADKSLIMREDFIMHYENQNYKLDVIERVEEDSWYKYILENVMILDMTKNITIKNGEYITILFSGGFVRDPRFDEHYAYDGNLGFFYTKEETTFRIWSPVARDINLELHELNGRLSSHPLKHVGRGLWLTTIKGDLEKCKYRFQVRIFDEYKVITDPYGIASDANGNYNYVIDKTKLNQFRYSKPDFSGRYTDAIIYEASVRDMTSKLDIPNNMRFDTLCEKLVTPKGHSAGLDYIASLGITHLQLMPIFDFYGISDMNPKRYYNWGYNPIQYFVPKGAYSSNPNDPYARINELINLVDMCHAYGILVNMDVVFNHVNDMRKFPFDNLVPGYFFRTSNGYSTNVSGCGNDLATERKMTSKFIIDNLIYMTETYHFSGYRFDLMGLLDVDTMNNIRHTLHKINPAIMLYGEGWNMPNTVPDNRRPHSLNYRYLPGIAFFNDRFRDFFKGSQWNKTAGFLLGGNQNYYDLTHLLTGSCVDYFQFDAPYRTINYVECHDNYTLYDFYKSLGKHYKESEIYDACKLGLCLVILAFGVPFIHSGQEFLRTKQGVENSYNSGDEINGIDWERKDSYSKLVQIMRDLITIRKTYPIFRIDSVQEIAESYEVVEELTTSNTITYRLKDKTYSLFIVIKMRKERLELKNINKTMIFDGVKLVNEPVRKVVLRDKGIYIFKDN